jgi:hypothetical protein
VTDFRIEPGGEYVKVFDVFGAGQLVVTLAPNTDGNACLTIGRATEEGIKEVSLGVRGARVEKTDHHFVEAFDEMDGDKAWEAWKYGTQHLPANDLG